MRKLTKILAVLALALALGAGMTLSAQAYILDFTVPASNPGASISFAGGANPLIGSGITISDVSLLDNFGNILGTLPIAGGVLSFATGNLSGSTPAPATWSFNGGGYINITGSILGGLPISLMNGSFQNAIVINFISGLMSFDIAGSSFIDTKAVELTNYFNIPSGLAWSGHFNLGFLVANQPAPPGGFTSIMVTSGDVINSAVPVPPTALLLGSGILGLVAWGWRRGRKED